MSMTLDEFNQLPAVDAVSALYGCCHCQSWAETVASHRPFATLEDLFGTAQSIWSGANEAEILEAFSGHARIGDIELLRSRYAGRATQEQGQVMAASEEVIKELYELNLAYEQKNGFIFIVCATGKSAEVMLSLLKERLPNSREEELRNGAGEQAKITQLRLSGLIAAQ